MLQHSGMCHTLPTALSQKLKMETVATKGMQCREACAFMTAAAKFHSHVEVRVGSRKVNGKIASELLKLGALKGTTLIISAKGVDAMKAVMLLRRFVENGFGETSDEGLLN